MIGLFLLGMIQHATADDKVFSKFSAQMPRPVTQVNAAPSLAATSDVATAGVIKSLAQLEEQSQELKMEYQRLRSRVQRLPQANVEASVSASSSFDWLAAVIASVGIAASVGVAAVRKYTSRGQQGSQSTTAFEVP